MKYQLPDDTQRLTVIGATGSGKTHAALWHLSMRNFDEKPWIIYDFKNEEMINSIEGLQDIGFDTPIPSRAGLYVLHAMPDQDVEISEHMMRIWAHEDVGVFIDEAYMVGNNNRGFRYLLTQGRSKHIPMIILQQLPVWVDRFVFSESDFFRVFRLQNSQDMKKVQEFIPYNLEERLPEFYSYYYEVKRNKVFKLGPVPDREAILDTFYTKLRRLKKVV